MNDSAIEIKQLKVLYPNCTDFALDVDELVIKKGMFVAVIGSSGSGKSTLLRSINGLLTPQYGEIKIFGKIYPFGHLKMLRQQVSMVFQNFNLIPRLNVINNVLLGRLAQKRYLHKTFALFNDYDREIAFSSLQKVGMLNYALRDIRSLSGGEKQRIAIARCLAQETKIILADEPVASLDPLNSIKIIELLKTLNMENDITILVNLHQLDLVDKYFSNVISIVNGSVDNIGDPARDKSDLMRVYK